MMKKRSMYGSSSIFDIDGNACSGTLSPRASSDITPGSEDEKIFNATYACYKKHYLKN